MKPFAYEQSRQKNHGKLILMILAGASFSIWYFDLVPQLDTVDTGHLDSDAGFSESEFLEMLESPVVENSPELSPIVDYGSEPSQSPEAIDDALLAALASQTEPIENSFPEFGSLNEPERPPLDMTEGNSVVPNNSNIQQTSFNSTTPGDVDPAIATTIVLDSETAARLRDVDERIAVGEILEAHAVLSKMYWKQPDVRTTIQERLEKTAAEIYANPNAHFAEPYEVQFGETLDGIAKKFDVPWQYLSRLNGVTAKTLQAGQALKVLNGPFGAVIDLSRFEMTIHAHGWFVRRYQVGIGDDHQTPLGEFTIENKLENPKWYNPSGGVVEGDDPSNPLGEYWMGLGNHIGIHGTINPASIGAAVSRGCIHLGDSDINEAFQLLGVGSKIVIR